MFKSQATVAVVPNPIAVEQQTACLITAIADQQLADYYRYVTNNALKINLIKPSWNAHITISKVNPSIPSDLNGRQISFEYDNNVRFNGDTEATFGPKSGKFWFIDVYSDDIRQIRSELGLPDHHKFHLTIGVNQGKFNLYWLLEQISPAK